MECLGFCLMAATVLLGALGVVLCTSPLRSALSLIIALCAIAVAYGLLDAPFAAAMQVLVYAGAIMVLFLFVIMLLDFGPPKGARPHYLAVSKVLGGVAVAYLTVISVLAAWVHPTQGHNLDGSVKHIGTLLLSDALFAFEAISLLLLVAVVGAVVLGLKRLT